MTDTKPVPNGSSFVGANIEPGLRKRPECAHQTPPPAATTPPAKQSLTGAHAPVRSRKPKRVAPEGVPIPTMGVQKFIYALHCMINRPDLVPRLSHKETGICTKREAERLVDQAKKSKDKELWLSEFFNSSGAMTVVIQNKDGKQTSEETHLKWEGQSLVIGVFTQKGGAGKTENCIRLARLYVQQAGVPLVLIVSATRNPGSTTRKARVASEDTLNLPELEVLFKEMEDKNEQWIDNKEVLARLRKNADGVYVIAQTNLPADFDDKRYEWVMERLAKIFTIIIQDTGNNTAKAGEIEYMAAQLADVLVFTCFTGVTDSPELMGATMDSYAILPQNQKEKLSSIISVVNGLRPEDPLEDWRRYAEFKIDEQGVTTGIRDFLYRVSARGGMEQTGTLLAIPWDDAVALNTGCDISQKTSDAYLELALQIALTKGRLQGLDLGMLDRIRSIKEMVATFDPTLLSKEYPTPQAWMSANRRGETPTNQ